MSDNKSADHAFWWNVEASWERRASWGGSARLFLGYAWMLNPGDLHCIETGINLGHCAKAHAGSGKSLPYLGAALGMAF